MSDSTHVLQPPIRPDIKRRIPIGDNGEEFAKPTRGPLPLVIGVTGHRDLRPEDVPTLEQLVRGILDDLHRRYPHTQLIILSPLAEGADRLGARVGLECGAQLVVPLPMPRDLYISDFKSEESLQEFEELLDRADASFEIPLLYGVNEDDIRYYGQMRDEQYGYMGAYIVRNSQFLIALWDGVPAKLNGTGDIVTFNIEGVPERFGPAHSLLEPVESDPVFHIITPRISNPHPHGESLTVHMIYPSEYTGENEAKEALEDVFVHTDMFNRDAVQYWDQLAGERQKSKSYVIDRNELMSVAPDLNPTLELYAIADSLAGRFSRHTHGTLKYLFVLVTVAAVIFDVYTHLFQHNWYLLLTYLFLLVCTYILVKRSERNNFQSKYLDYRALAEGLRVQFFWELADIRDSVADYYLHKQRSELDWVRYAIRIWDIPSHRDKSWDAQEESEVDPERLRLVLKHWVDDQFKYYGRASKREEHGMRRLEIWGTRLIILGITLATIQVILQILLPPSEHGGAHSLFDQPMHPLLVAVALAPILAGLMIGYAEKRGFGDHAKQYERMSVLFANARLHLHRVLDAGDRDRAQQLVAELGREALMENGDWVLLHRDRPIEVPKG